MFISSFIRKNDKNAKTIAPIENPTNLPGQSCPLKLSAQYFVDFMRIYEIGNPNKLTMKGLFLNQVDIN